MIDLGPIKSKKTNLLPEVFSVKLVNKKPRYDGFLLDGDKAGIYEITWPVGAEIGSEPHRWYHHLFGLEPKPKIIPVESRTESFYYVSSTSISCFPSLEELRYRSSMFELVKAAIDRHYIRLQLNMPHPFETKDSEDEGEVGANTVKTSEYR